MQVRAMVKIKKTFCILLPYLLLRGLNNIAAPLNKILGAAPVPPPPTSYTTEIREESATSFPKVFGGSACHLQGLAGQSDSPKFNFNGITRTLDWSFERPGTLCSWPHHKTKIFGRSWLSRKPGQNYPDRSEYDKFGIIEWIFLTENVNER